MTDEQKMDEVTARLDQMDAMLADMRRLLPVLDRIDDDFVDTLMNAPLGICWVAKDHTILWSNNTLLRDLGYEENDFVRHNETEFIPDARQLVHHDLELLEGMAPAALTLIILGKGGNQYVCRVISNPRFHKKEFRHLRRFIRVMSKVPVDAE